MVRVQFLSRRDHFEHLCNELRKQGVDCSLIDNKKSRNYFTYPSNYYINSIDCDVLVTHSPYHGLRGASQAKKRKRVRHIIFRLKADHWTEQESKDVSFKNRLGFMIKKHQYESSYRDVDIVLAISEYMKQIAIRNGLDKTIHVMPNGVDIERFNRREVAPAYESTILCVMNFDVPEKVKTLNTFFEEYRDRSLEHPVLVLGDGNKLRQTMKNVERLGLENQVRFRGYVKDIENYYAGCKVLVHPSGLESFGMVLLEAGASGKPVVATSVGGIPEIVKHGVTGLLADNMEQLVRYTETLLDDPVKQLRYGNAAYNLVRENFTWEKISKDFIDILKQEGIHDHP
ncbi:MAG TPA: glycosyltransferase family 4 protein [Candidatus Bathyarchaeia archaeon]